MRKEFYDYFSSKTDSNGDYINLGTYEEFDKDMQDAPTRKALYDYISSQVDENGKYYNLGTFAEFEQDIARSTAKEIGKASAQATGQAIKEQPKVVRPVTAVQSSDLANPFYTEEAYMEWLAQQPKSATKQANQELASGQVTETPTAPSAPKAEDITTTKATATTAEAPKVETTENPVSALQKKDGTPYSAEELQGRVSQQQAESTAQVGEQPIVQVESVDESLVTPTETDQAKLETKDTKAEGDQKAEDGDESWEEYKAKLKDLYGGMNIPEASQVGNFIGISLPGGDPMNRYAPQYIEYAEQKVLQKLHEIAIEQNGGQPLSDAQMIAITNQAKSMSEKDVQKVLGAEGLEALRKAKEQMESFEKRDQRNAHVINELLADPSVAEYLKQFGDSEYLAELATNAVVGSEVELGQMNANDASKYIGARMAKVDYLLGDDAMQYYLQNINNNETNEKGEKAKQKKAQAILSTAVTINDLLYGGIGLPEKAKAYARNALTTAVKNGQIGTTDGNAVVNDVLNRLQNYPQLFGQLSEDAKKVVLDRLNYVLPTAKISSLKDAMWGDTTIYNALIGEITKYYQQLGAVEDFDSKRNEAEEKYKEMIEDAGSAFQGNPYAPGWVNVKNWADHTVDQIPDAREWSVAIDMNDDTADILNNSAKSGFGGFFQGLADGVFDLSTWDFGFSDIQKNRAIKNVLTKLDNDEPLTEGETALADAIVSNLAAQALVSSSMAYKVGNGVGYSIPYLLEMALPVFGVGKGVARKLYTFALKREAKGALKKIAKTIAKASGSGADALTRAVLYGGGKISANVIKQTTGEADIQRDENGELKVVGTKEGTKESLGKAITKSFLSQAATYFEERVGGDIFSFANIPLVKGKKLLLDKVGVEFTPNEMWDDFVKRTGWQGTPDEFFEEILDQVVQATIEGEGFDEIATADNLLTTAYTTLALGTMLNAPNAIGYKSESKRLESQIENLSAMGEVALGKEWEGIQSRIDNAIFGEIQGVLSDIAKDKKLTPEQKRIAINYGLNVGVNKEIIDRHEKGQLYDKDNESIKAQETIINAIEQGANITDVNEGYNSQIRENMTGESLVRMVGVESISEAKDVIAQRYGTDSPMEIAIEVANDASLNDTQRKVILDYYTALATNQGKQTALERKRDINKQAADAVSAKTNKDMGKQVVTATRKVDGAQVTIIAGNIVTNEDGSINKEKSDDAIVSVDADGNKEMISLGNISSITTQSKEDAELEERAKLTQELEKAENVSNGRVSVGDVIDYGFYDGNTNAKSRKVVVTDVTTDADGNRMVTFVEQELNGAEPVTMTEKELEVGRGIAYFANNSYQLYNGPVGLPNATAQATQAELTQEQAPITQVAEQAPQVESTEAVEESTEQPTAIEPGVMVSLADGSVGEVVSMSEDGRVIVEHEDGSTNEYNVGDLKVAEKPSAQTAQATQAPTAPQVESTPVVEQAESAQQVESTATPTAQVAIPTDEKGKKVYEQAPIDATINDIYNDPELDEEEADAYVQARIDGATKRIEAIDKKKPKMGEDRDAYVAQRDAWRAERGAEQAKLDYWQGVQAQRAQGKANAPKSSLRTNEPTGATPSANVSSAPSPKMDTPKAEPTAPPMESKLKAKPIKIGTKRNAKGQVIGLIDSPLAQVLNNTTRRILNKLGESLGVSIHIVPHLEGANAKIEGNRITIAIDAEQGPLKALGHELLHRIKSLSPKAYEDFADVVEKIVPSFQARMVATRLVYSNAGRKIDMKLLREEVVADLAGDVMYHAGLMQKFVEVLRPKNTKEIIMDTMRDLYARIRGVFEGEGARNFAKAERVLLDAMKKANKVVAQEETIEADNATEKLSIIGESGASEVAEDKGVVDINEKEGQALFSLRTYNEGGRESLQNFVASQVDKGALTQEQAQEIVEEMETIYDICEQYTGEYAPFGNWSEAEVVRDERGIPVLSVIKANGDYKMNLDFSLVCKKRRTLDAVFQEMINRGVISNFELGQVDIARVNDIIREHGFETACRLCFVDSKRFRTPKVADDFATLYNELVDMSDTQLKKVIKGEAKNTVRKKTANHLLKHPEDRVKVGRDNFITAQGFEQMKKDRPYILSLYNMAKGSGGPKASFGDVQYMNDVQNTNWTPEKAYAVGGVRLQSFSDYVPRMVFDYVQLLADLSAKQLPVHAYTKEPTFAKQFGLSGIKINLSLVPRVDADGVAPGLDKDGNYAWQEGETFPYDVAVELQNAEGYKENVGTIAVGVSDEHIAKLLDDPNIRMVIPYHKSGLNKQVAIKNNIDAFVDYTNSQNTRKADGTKAAKAGLNGMPDFNQDIHKGMHPREAAQRYLDWCEKKGYLPKFDQFRDHPNYYKMLEDFTTIIEENGEERVVPQGAVSMTFPTESDAFGSMESLIKEGLEEDAILEGNRQAKVGEIVDEIEDALADTKYSLRSNSQEVADIVAKAKADGTYMKAPNGEATNLTEEQWANVRTKAFKDWFGNWENDPENSSKVVDENGEPMVVYHGTESDFNVFDRTKGRASMDIQGMFFSPWELDAQGYGRNVRAFYLNIRKPSSGGQSYKALNRYQGQDYAGVKARDYLISLGYDGVNNYGEEFIAFSPNQIKSATENVGTYSSEDNDIRYSLRGNVDARKIATDAVIEMLGNSGIEVVKVSDAEAQEMLRLGGMEMNAKKKRVLETVSIQENEHQQTVISSTDGAKILNNIDNLAKEYDKKTKTEEKTFIGKLAKELEAKRKGSGSQYATFETKNGKIVTIRLSNHNAKVSNFDNNDEKDGISIVVSAKGNDGIINDGDAHIVEYYYDAIKLRRADGKPLADIIRSIKQALYSGEFKDPTGLAERQEVNLNNPEFHIVYHGSGAKFDAFNHSHMGEGEGAQAFGWGTYVTESEGVGREYGKVASYRSGNGRFLYTVEIPDDANNAYIPFDEVVPDYVKNKVKDAIDFLLNTNHMANWYAENMEMDNTYKVFSPRMTGEMLYKTVSKYLVGDERASKFLNDLGFVGIKYPTNYLHGGNAEGQNNYLIFNERDAKIIDRVEFLKTAQGEVYGWTDGKRVYLTEKGMNPETPIHEYTHIWARAMKGQNAKGWQSVKDLLRDTPMWNEVMNDANYADIRENEDAVASEVLSRISGKENAERMMQEAQKMIDNAKGVFEKADVVTLVDRMRRALKEFWSWVGKNLFGIEKFNSIEEVTDRVLYDLVNNTELGVSEDAVERMVKKIKKAELDRTPPQNEENARNLIQNLIEVSKRIKDEVVRVVVAGMTPKQIDDLNKIGLDVNNVWVHSVENSRLIHNNDHVEKEKRKGQLPISENEYLLIPTILENYDSVEMSPNKNKEGNKVIIYKKKFPNNEIYYLEEVRTGRKSLAFQSMYKKRSDSSDGLMNENPSPSTPLAPSDNLTSADKGRNNLGENQENDTKYSLRVGGVLHPQGDDYDGTRKEYNDKVKSFGYKMREGYQDSMLALKELQKIVAKANGKKVEDIPSWQNAYIEENLMSSKNKAQHDAYVRDYYKPLINVVKKLIKKGGMKYDDIKQYLIAKHGLERNEKMAIQEAKKVADNAIYKREQDAKNWARIKANQAVEGVDFVDDVARNEAWKQVFDEVYKRETFTSEEEKQATWEEVFNKQMKQNRNRDYSGLTAMFGVENVHEAEKMARELVDKVEQPTGKMDELWNAIRSATEETLATQYKAGLLSRDEFEKIRDMYEYYVPLRGFDEKTADEEYEYLVNKKPILQAMNAKAMGRSSLADDPLATIGAMADSAIIQSNRNKMKQAFYHFVKNNPSALVTESEQWYVQDGEGHWVATQPGIPANATSADIEEAIAEHEERMKALKKEGKARTKPNTLDTNFITLPGQAVEHMVKLKINGKEKVLYINGNPRAAQAVNGLTNPEAFNDVIRDFGKAVNNYMAQVFTSKNPAFIFTNGARDLQWAANAVMVKEGWKYQKQYAKNIGKASQVAKYILKYNNGTLNLDDETQRYFNEFISSGGETGYTAINQLDHYKKEIAKMIKGVSKVNPMTTINGVLDSIEYLNRSVEDITRFAVFMTSRQMGRSLQQSAYDAKEITVNFNKKGSGIMGARYLGAFYIFLNASLQSINNLCRIVKHHPIKATIKFAEIGAVAYALPMLNELLIEAWGDDDDKEAYANLPEWVKKNNVVVYIPGTDGMFFTIPMSHEMRPFATIGYVAHKVMNEGYDAKEGMKDIISAFGDMLPIEITGNDGNMAVNLTPTFLQPIAQLIANTDYFGKPIYRDADYTELKPEYTTAFRGTSPILIDASKYINEISGGDAGVKGKADGMITNPDVLEHLIESYFGGLGKLVNKGVKSISAIWDEQLREVRNIPVVSSFVAGSEERTSTGFKQSEEYYALIDEYKKYESKRSSYKEEVLKGARPNATTEEKMNSLEYANKLTELMTSPEAKRYITIKGYKNYVDALNKGLENVDITRRADVEKMLNELKEELISEVDKAENKDVEELTKRNEKFKNDAKNILKDANPYTGLAQDEAYLTNSQMVKDLDETVRENNVGAFREWVDKFIKDKHK